MRYHCDDVYCLGTDAVLASFECCSDGASGAQSVSCYMPMVSYCLLNFLPSVADVHATASQKKLYVPTIAPSSSKLHTGSNNFCRQNLNTCKTLRNFSFQCILTFTYCGIYYIYFRRHNSYTYVQKHIYIKMMKKYALMGFLSWLWRGCCRLLYKLHLSHLNFSRSVVIIWFQWLTCIIIISFTVTV